MPKDRILRGLYFAGRVTDIAEWFADNSGDAKTIFHPFGGVGRYASAVSNPGVTVDNWDVQLLCKAIIDGVFNKQTLETNVTTPMGLKGYQFENRYYKNIDDHSAGFMDWVGVHGTLADKFAMITASCSMTEMGRLDNWKATFEDFWSKFQINRDRLRPYLNMPGTLNVIEGDVFDEDLETRSYDLMILDPPIAPDTYFHNAVYTHMNKNIGGVVTIPQWTLPTFYGRVRRLLSMDVKVILAKYQTNAIPPLSEYRDILSEYGTVVLETKFSRKKYNEWTFKVVR